MRPSSLSPAQREFVEEVLEGAPGWVVLEGPAGSGKTTALHAAVRQAALSGWRVLMASPYAISLEHVALWLRDAAPNVRIEVLTKGRFREIATTEGFEAEGSPGVYLTQMGLLSHRDVSTALSHMAWDLIAIEDGLAGEAAASVSVSVQSEGASVRVGERGGGARSSGCDGGVRWR